MQNARVCTAGVAIDIHGLHGTRRKQGQGARGGGSGGSCGGRTDYIPAPPSGSRVPKGVGARNGNKFVPEMGISCQVAHKIRANLRTLHAYVQFLRWCKTEGAVENLNLRFARDHPVRD